jgi:hypothetical protein
MRVVERVGCAKDSLEMLGLKRVTSMITKDVGDSEIQYCTSMCV